MCGGECQRMSTDIQRLWNTFVLLESKWSDEIAKRLDGALQYYEERGWILHYVGYGETLILDIKTRELYRTETDGSKHIVHKLEK